MKTSRVKIDEIQVSGDNSAAVSAQLFRAHRAGGEPRNSLLPFFAGWSLSQDLHLVLIDFDFA